MRVAAIALALAASPAAAQAPEAVAAATELVDLLSPPAEQKAALDRQLKAMRAGKAAEAQLSRSPGFRAAAARNPARFDAALARIGAMQADALGPILTEMLSASRRATIDSYAKAFTAEELRAILAFYRTPAGQRLRERQAGINAEVARTIRERYEARTRAAEQSIQPRIQAEIEKLAPPRGQAK